MLDDAAEAGVEREVARDEDIEDREVRLEGAEDLVKVLALVNAIPPLREEEEVVLVRVAERASGEVLRRRRDLDGLGATRGRSDVLRTGSGALGEVLALRRVDERDEVVRGGDGDVEEPEEEVAQVEVRSGEGWVLRKDEERVLHVANREERAQEAQFLVRELARGGGGSSGRGG